MHLALALNVQLEMITISSLIIIGFFPPWPKVHKSIIYRLLVSSSQGRTNIQFRAVMLWTGPQNGICDEFFSLQSAVGLNLLGRWPHHHHCSKIDDEVFKSFFKKSTNCFIDLMWKSVKYSAVVIKIVGLFSFPVI